MTKSRAFAAFALAAALISTAAMAEDEKIHKVSACTQDGRTVSTSMIVSLSHRPVSEVQSILDKTFADVAARHSAAEFESASMLYSNLNKHALAEDMKAALAGVDHQYGIVAHSPLLPARTAPGCTPK